MRIPLVLDTNVLISGYLWNGKPRQLLRLVKKGGFTILYSKETINEFARVLSLKFGFAADAIHTIIVDMSTMGEKITIKSDESPILDDMTDNVFINLALDGNATTVVSGDSHLLKLKRFENIEIVTVSHFLKRYG
jgi:putative PIN family toxin of toxin-antitoxin system